MKKLIVPGLILFLIILGLRIYQKISEKPAPGISQLQKEAGIPVDVFIVKKQSIFDEIVLTGAVGSEEEANISSKIPGRVISVDADTGMSVKAKQTLVIIDDSQLKIQKMQIQNQILVAQANMDAIKIQINDAERDLNRMEELYKENVISKKQLEGYQVKLETLQKNYESAQKSLQVVKDNLKLIDIQIEDCIVRAPFDGIIGNKRVEMGEIVGPGQVLMIIYNTKKLNAQMKIPEAYVPKLKYGQNVQLELDAFEGKTITGKITKISGTPDPKTRMFIVYISLPFADSVIKPGMFAKGTVAIDKKTDTIMIPEKAVFEESGKKFVYIVENGRAKKIEVKLGEYSNGSVEIKSGLSDGNMVVVFGKENLSPDSRVQIITQINSQ